MRKLVKNPPPCLPAGTCGVFLMLYLNFDFDDFLIFPVSCFLVSWLVLFRGPERCVAHDFFFPAWFLHEIFGYLYAIANSTFIFHRFQTLFGRKVVDMRGNMNPKNDCKSFQNASLEPNQFQSADLLDNLLFTIPNWPRGLCVGLKFVRKSITIATSVQLFFECQQSLLECQHVSKLGSTWLQLGHNMDPLGGSWEGSTAAKLVPGPLRACQAFP